MTILSTLAANAAMFACEIDFNDAEAHAGTSFVPFLGFMVFLIGLVFCFIGIVKINDAKSSGIFSTITVIKMTENSLSMQKRKNRHYICCYWSSMYDSFIYYYALRAEMSKSGVSRQCFM